MRRNKSGKRTVRVAAYLLAAVLAVSTFAGCGGIESGGEAEGTADSGNEKEAGEQNNAMGRYVESEELLGGVFFPCDDRAAGAITGVVLPIDAGFAAYSGV